MKNRFESDLERNLNSEPDIDGDLAEPIGPPKLTKNIMNVVDCASLGLAYLTGAYLLIKSLATEVVPELHNEIYRLYVDIAQYVDTFT